jgi:hypothetical protein
MPRRKGGGGRLTTHRWLRRRRERGAATQSAAARRDQRRQCSRHSCGHPPRNRTSMREIENNVKKQVDSIFNIEGNNSGFTFRTPAMPSLPHPFPPSPSPLSLSLHNTLPPPSILAPSHLHPHCIPGAGGRKQRGRQRLLRVRSSGRRGLERVKVKELANGHKLARDCLHRLLPDHATEEGAHGACESGLPQM